MPLPTSGPISLLDIQNEFGGSNPIGINEYYGVGSGVPASGTISLFDFYGLSNAYNLIISANQTNLNLRSYAIANGWDGSASLNVTINSSVVIYSTTSTYALTIDGSFPSGITLINNGVIVGDGGNGGAGGSNGIGGGGSVGGVGGSAQNALFVDTPTTIDNQGTIAGGGGGGGGGGGSSYQWVGLPGGGGGGGRSGLQNSNGGSASRPGSAGTFSAPGTGGARTTYIFTYGGRGGTGGEWGASGENGEAAWNRAGGAGGAGGSAVAGDSNITWINTGTRLGSVS